MNIRERVLIPLEQAGKLETAKKARIIISQVFRYCMVLELVDTDPAAALASIAKAPSRKHFAAVTAPEDIKVVWQAINGYPKVATRCALLLQALTFQRPFTVRAAEWSEFDLDNLLWTIPALKMKMPTTKKASAPPHKVPLSTQTVKVLGLVPRITNTPYLFPSERSRERSISDSTLTVALRIAGIPKEMMTAHGFRTTASSTLHGCGLWRWEAVERQLAHAIGNNVEMAYNRADYLDERVKMMQWYGDFLESFGSIEPA